MLGGVVQDDEPENHVELLPYPLQCSVIMKLTNPALINMLECKIVSLGHQYRIRHSTISRDFDSPISVYGGVAFLPLSKEEGGGFMALLNVDDGLMLLKSAEMRWTRLKNIPWLCMDLVTFRGKFYATFSTMETFVIDPYSLGVTPLMPLQHMDSSNYLVRCGDDELFLVELIHPPISDVFDLNSYTCRVSKLNEEAGRWDEVRDLGDRVFFIGDQGNFSCLAKELFDGRVSGDSVLFTNWSSEGAFFYQYGLQTGSAEEDLPSCLRVSTENRVTVIYNTFPVLALLVESKL